MIFVIGGAYQGKTEYVKEHFSNCRIWDHYHLTVWEQLDNGKDPLKEAERMLETDGKKTGKDLVIVSNELGYGLVPVDVKQREYREVNGRVNCYFAQQAQEVIHMVCGQAQRIK